MYIKCVILVLQRNSMNFQVKILQGLLVTHHLKFIQNLKIHKVVYKVTILRMMFLV